MPKLTLDLPLPMIQLDASNSIPLHRQLYHQLRAAICAGDLKPGTRLPSTRALAAELGVSRTTTSEAYRDLLAEGYLEAQVGAGTSVVQHLPALARDAGTEAKVGARPIPTPLNQPGGEASLHLSQLGQRLVNMVKPAWYFTASPVRPFRLGVPALDAIPQKAWSRLIARVARQAEPSQLDYQRAAGYVPLREEIAAYLAVARGVRCQPEQVIITTGIQSGLSLICHVLLDQGDAIWMEDPGYFLAQSLFQAFGIQMVPVSIDGEGLCVAIGQQQAPTARLAYVTPSHQFPLGMTMSQARRRALLQWAQQTGSWIIEDDYDSEYRYIGRPIPALQGLDESGRVIYMGTFSKVFFPALRLGYLVVPPTLVDLFTVAQRLIHFHPPILEQMAMAAFMAEGEFVRHIRRMRGLYSERYECLVGQIKQQLTGILHVEKSACGLHLVGWLHADADEAALTRLAAQHAVTVYPLSSFHLGASAERKGFVLGFAAFGEKEIKAGVEQLARAWAQENKSSSPRFLP